MRSQSNASGRVFNIKQGLIELDKAESASLKSAVPTQLQSDGSRVLAVRYSSLQSLDSGDRDTFTDKKYGKRG